MKYILVTLALFVSITSSVFIAGKTPDKFSEELLDFLVSCIGSRGVDGVPDIKQKNGSAPLSNKDYLACLTKDQRSQMVSTLESCEEKIKNEFSSDIDKKSETNLYSQCLFAKMAGFNESSGQFNTTQLKAMIAGTSLSKDNITGAQNTLDKCIKDDMNVPRPLTELTSKNTDFVNMLVDGWLFNMMNGHSRWNATEEAKAVQFLRSHYGLLKSILCFTESLMENGCSSIGQKS